MNLETGTPTFEGRYLVFVPGLLEWLEPVVVTWMRGKWFYRHSTQEFPDDVRFWHGPLPVMKAEAPALQEFDL